jgi:SAM-dependent methyltransferase
MADESPRTRWQELGGVSGAEYAARFAGPAARGEDMHGEASLCAALVPPGARILDAGCGTGRVAIRLASIGYDVVGIDVDSSMLAVARQHGPSVPWYRGDLSALPAGLLAESPFDLVVMAGNVVPLLAPGTLPDAVRALVAVLRPGGLLLAGFGLDPAHLPPRCPVTPLEEYDEAAAGHGLELVDRFSTWDGAPYDEAAGYAVSVHRTR